MIVVNKELLKTLHDNHPEAIPIQPNLLQLLHSKDPVTAQVISMVLEEEDDVVCYYLPEGTYGALPSKCCNGIRYGEDSAYLSLPHISYEDVAKYFMH